MNAEKVIADVNWLPIAIGNNKHIVFQKFEDGGVSESTFLDNRAKGMTKDRVQIPPNTLFNIAKSMKKSQPIKELFHISHVGSTLLGKVVQSMPNSISFREPTIFRDIVSKYYDFHAGSNLFYAKEMPLLLASVYAMFRRGGEEHIFIKQTSGNLILPHQIDDKTQAQLANPTKGAFLYTSAKDFLSHGCKSQGTLADAVQSAPRRIGYFNRLCTFRKLELADLKPLEKVALIWITEMQKLRARTSLTGHANAINFDACLRENGKESLVDALCACFELDDHRDALLESDAWNSNSKSGKPFEASERTEVLNKNYLAHKIDVEKALTWIREICYENVTFTPLLSDLE